MEGRIRRLVCVALIAVLSGTPAFAAVCADLCGLNVAPASTSAHCSKHGATATRSSAEPSAPSHHEMPVASHDDSDRVAQHHGDEDRVTIVMARRPVCCDRVATASAVAIKVSRADGLWPPVLAPSGPYVPMSIARAELRLPQPGSSRSRALSRAPLVLRI